MVAGEFAQVAVAVDATARGPRLRLTDLRTGRVRYLDPLELETIIWLRDSHFRQLLDPSADRWRDDVTESAGAVVPTFSEEEK
ncbi:hypothetical protein [Nocardia bovistercoris]|uniref:Dihydrodiol dehydrogenase n=1 Tax=Nocardia bovistercoris TaxID=2785916 RepID=A0A931N343_9NOCA|nr:hypothetical protein [Nocardia bovistercoris]